MQMGGNAVNDSHCLQSVESLGLARWERRNSFYNRPGSDLPVL